VIKVKLDVTIGDCKLNIRNQLVTKSMESHLPWYPVLTEQVILTMNVIKRLDKYWQFFLLVHARLQFTAPITIPYIAMQTLYYSVH